MKVKRDLLRYEVERFVDVLDVLNLEGLELLVRRFRLLLQSPELPYQIVLVLAQEKEKILLLTSEVPLPIVFVIRAFSEIDTFLALLDSFLQKQ